MGSLKLYGAVAGLGKGLGEMGKREHELKVEGERTARDIQLQRMRDKSALERQREADTAATAREEARYGPGGYEEAGARVQAELEEELRTSQHLRDVEIERMRQEAQTRREQMRITENTPEFTWEEIPESSRFDPMSGQTITQPRQVTVRDAGGTYIETGSTEGQIFVPSTLMPPPPDQIKRGMEPSIVNWLISAPDRETRENRKYQYLRLYGFLPSQYFSAYDPRRTRTVERTSAEGTTPAVNQ